MQPFDNGGALHDGLGMILREISRRRVVSPDHRAAIYGKSLVYILDESGGVANQRLQQRSFARPIASHQRNFLAALHTSAKRLKHPDAIVRFHDALDFQRMPPGMLVQLKSDERPRDIRSGEFSRLQPLHFFFPRSSLRRARARRKARDEFI